MRVSVTSRTAVYGPVRTVVWEGRSREAPPYPDLWHETDMPKYLGDVRYWVNSGKHLLSLSFSGFDPSLTSRRSDDQLGLTQLFRRWCDEFLTPESPCSPSSARTPQTARSAPAET